MRDEDGRGLAPVDNENPPRAHRLALQILLCETDLGQDLDTVLVDRGRLCAPRTVRRWEQPRDAGNGHRPNAWLLDPGDDTRRLHVRIPEEFDVAVHARVHESRRLEPLSEFRGGLRGKSGLQEGR